jgi:hypothetical protein
MFGRAMQGCLNTTGKLVQEYMREQTTPHDSSGRTTDSITWQTAKTGAAVGSHARDEDKIDKPSAKNEVWVGSQASSAQPREEGAGQHVNSEGSEEFIKEMKAWVKRELGIDPDGSPEERSHFWAIITNIRNKGLPAVPFVSTSKDYAESVVLSSWKTAIRKELKAHRKGK